MSELSASNMFEAQTVLADHKDLIHDIAYDFYGERMATCSSDHYVKIWDADAQGNWKLTASWKAHHSSVWKVTWSHPEFGQVIATCSFDRTAAVWEEVGEIPASGTEKGLRTWVKRSNLVDSRTSVTDVKFGPKHLGLLLVTCSADGIIRIYEAPDVMNLAQWTLQHEIPTKVSISCLSWNPSMSRYNPPMLAVGSDEPGPAAVSAQNDKGPLCNGKVFIYEYTESARRWTRTECLSQCAEAVNDLAFAPNLGRAFHVLAVASKDVRIIKIEPTPTSTESQPNGSTAPAGRFKVSVMAAFDDHRACVWRVAWNVTGTLLASSGDDCRVRLWKMQYLNQFRCVGVLKNGSPGDERPAGGPAGGPAVAGGPAGGPGGAERGHTSYVRMAAMDNPAQMPVH